jgi:hypothetical protein
MATTTPNYGWDVPTSTDYVKDGATAIETLGDDIDATLWTALGGAYPGLRLVKKQTIGSGVSSVVVTSAFSATYANYLIIMSNADFSNNSQNILFKMNSSTGSTYQYYGSWFAYGGGTAVLRSSGDPTAIVGFTGASNDGNVMIDVISPFLTTNSNFTYKNSNDSYFVFGGGAELNAISHTGFTISTANTISGGTIYVYGYGAS